MRERWRSVWQELTFPAVLLLSSLSTPALAANCKNDGGLLFLGTNKSDSRSIWVSGTVAGDYRLDAAQGNQTVDTWSRSSTGLHLSTSPVVSTGNGGTHKLYGVDGGSDCLIDTQNQKRDFQLPENIKPPSLIKPPIGRLFPDFGRPVPPIAILPPSGVMPGRPGPVSPPASGITPPIGTLPPSGITPPIGTLPPGGFSPGRPGAITPPIGVVPPSGVLPGAPGGITPPIGTLPPSGGLPGAPGGPGTVTPPIGTLPPGGRNPNQPGLPAGFVPVRRADGQVISYCVDPRSADETQAASEQAFCTREQLLAAGRLQEQEEVPITPGRDLLEPTLWNGWSTVTGVYSDDRRFGRDFQTLSGTAAIGADRKLTDDIVAGLSVTFETVNTDGFNSALKIDTQGFEIGPYVAARLSQHWAVDGSLSYGFSNSQSDISVLSGDYNTHEFGAVFSVHGQYALSDIQVRPKATVTFNRLFSDGYDLNGTIRNRAVSVPISGNATSLGTVELSTEFSRQFTLQDRFLIQPYVEAGAVYEYLRPNDGKILDDELNFVTASAWSFTLRGGATALLSENVTLDAKGGYLSLGQNGLDVWEGQLRIAIGF
ncbi:autotransporter domain-containing protein [Stappia sp. BW2]|uniref:autotransporter domain-containing protein n=1 Tax=Stappia sp. BW2 TaxID=2592622 RepID=UPI0011DEA791|nr:autotransporter domain-containing protein [Stappia sp. BW2]TYC66080.1 autotransporter domain-containing protein [Stappia sp. BW2]